jgi:hypothetical protein
VGGWIGHLVRLSVKRKKKREWTYSGEYEAFLFAEGCRGHLVRPSVSKKLKSRVYEAVYLWEEGVAIS